MRDAIILRLSSKLTPKSIYSISFSLSMFLAKTGMSIDGMFQQILSFLVPVSDMYQPDLDRYCLCAQSLYWSLKDKKVILSDMMGLDDVCVQPTKRSKFAHLSG